MTAPPSPGGEDLAIPDAPLPVSILTGFLGSGKTTLLRYLLGRPGMAQTAVIVNEFGEIGLDHLLVEKIDDNAVLLNSGCLCCTVRGDLVEAMRRLFKQRVRREIPPFERLVIETTGLADPAPVLQTMMSDPLIASRFRLDGVVTTVDGLLGDASLKRHLESVKQAAVADRIVITKTDLAPPQDVAALRARLRKLNPAASILEAVDGRIEPAELFDAGHYNPQTGSLDLERWLKAEAYGHDGHGDHDHAHDVNRHGDGIRAFCVTYDKPLEWERFSSWIEGGGPSGSSRHSRRSACLSSAGAARRLARRRPTLEDRFHHPRPGGGDVREHPESLQRGQRRPPGAARTVRAGRAEERNEA
jgi:G3E family GTPase